MTTRQMFSVEHIRAIASIAIESYERGARAAGHTLGPLPDGRGSFRALPEGAVDMAGRDRGGQGSRVPPVQVNVFQPGTGHGQDDKADVRHAELRQDLHAVRKSVDGVGEAVAGVKRDNEDLMAMQAAGLFKFMERVDPREMGLFLAILQHGDQSKAARALRMSDGAFRDRTKAWAAMSRPYRVMHRLIAWRKTVGRKEKVPFADTLVQQIQQGEDREGILRQVLEGLAEMDGKNWAGVRDELESAIREVME